MEALALGLDDMAISLPSRGVFFDTLDTTICHPSQDEECIICQDGYCNAEDHHGVTTPCGHTYGQSCLIDWLCSPGVNTCPMCRRELFYADSYDEWFADDGEGWLNSDEEPWLEADWDDLNSLTECEVEAMVEMMWESVVEKMPTRRAESAHDRNEDDNDSGQGCSRHEVPTEWNVMPSLILLLNEFYLSLPGLVWAMNDGRAEWVESALVNMMTECIDNGTTALDDVPTSKRDWWMYCFGSALGFRRPLPVMELQPSL